MKGKSWCVVVKTVIIVILFCDRDYKVEWEKIKAQAELKKAEELKNKNSEMLESNLLTEIPVGRELSDVYLRHPANESSSDSEGEEAPFNGIFCIF